MAKTMKQLAQDAYLQGFYSDPYDWKDGYIKGGNAALEEIETYINNLDLGNSTEEKFYRLDTIADIGLFIKQLKGE